MSEKILKIEVKHKSGLVSTHEVSWRLETNEQEVCNICGSKLHNRFYEDFPEKYKICCFCLKTANFIYSDLMIEYDKNLINSIIDGASHLRKNYELYKKKFDNLFKIKKETLRLIKNEC